MKKILFLILVFSYFSAFTQQKHLTVYSEDSDIRHQIYVGSSFPLRVHAGYEFQYKRLQIGVFAGFTPKRYQNFVLEFLKKIQNSYQDELSYVKVMAEPKFQYGGELKLNIGRNISIGATAQTFNATITDTPKRMVEGVLPEEAANISSLANYSAEVKSAYETKQIEAFMNTILAGPTIEKTFWLNANETIFIKAKVAYWFLVKREYDLTTKDFTTLEQLGIDTFKPRFVNKLEKVSSQLQAPSFGLELGISF
ncbi:MAG: hypothetical protein V4585_20275 [Bacteroidota bacterium]|jgi:hypothetical protein